MVQTKARKSVVLSSEDDSDAQDVPVSTTENPSVVKSGPTGSQHDVAKPTKKRQRPSRNGQPIQTTTSNSVQSAPKKRGATTSSTKQGENSNGGKSLRSFFGPAPQVGQLPKALDAKPEPHEAEDELEDIDDDDYEGSRLTRRTQKSDAAPKDLAIRKRSWSAATEGRPVPERHPCGPKFLKVQHRAGSPTVPLPSLSTQMHDERPWNTKYAPTSLDEVAVHPKKTADVRAWLEAVYNGRLYQRLLILKGPAGCGKSTTVNTLAPQMGSTVMEWQNPDLAELGSVDYVSYSSQFADFLSRAGQFQRLNIVTSSGAQLPQSPADQPDGKRLILIEEFPNLAGSSTTVLQSFRSQILQYLASSTLPRSVSADIPTPLILVVSESVLASSSTSDNLTAHRLLGRDILHHPATTVIEFNPVAPTIITKALKLVLQKHTRATGRAQPVSPAVVQRLSEIGDVRNAVSTLEYLCKNLALLDAIALPASSKSKRKGSKSTTKKVSPTTADQDALSMVTMRESTLGLFHVVAKVVYNKRDEPSDHQDNDDEVSRRDRPPPVLDSGALLATAGADTSTLLSTLHENYILSCTPPTRPSDTDCTLANIEGCLTALEDADILGTSSMGAFNNGHNHGVVSEGLRQDEIAFDVGVRGLQYALPYPVKRISAATTVGTRASAERRYQPDVNRMFYPMDIKLWRRREEARDMMDYLMTQVQRGQLVVDRASPPPEGQLQGALKDFSRESISQPGRMMKGTLPTSHSQAHDTPDSAEDPQNEDLQNDGTGALPPRLTVLLEQLPYYLHISHANSNLDTRTHEVSSLLEEVEQIVRFRGIGTRRDDESDDDEGSGPTFQSKRFRAGQKASAFSSGGFQPAEGVEGDVEKLVLSDDDIVDE